MLNGQYEPVKGVQMPQYNYITIIIPIFNSYTLSQEYSASVQATFLPQVLQSICKYLHAHVATLNGATLAHAIETSSNLLSRAQPTTVNTENLYTTPDSESFLMLLILNREVCSILEFNMV